MKILALDTATEACSVALRLDDRVIERYVEMEKGHAERILPMVDEVLAEAGLTLHDLDALAFGRGPGAFTGVRLAASVAQGLAYGAGLRVVPVSDLRAIAQIVLERSPDARRVLVCGDARMQEVYWACFERGADGLAAPVGEERVSAPERVELPADWTADIHGAGRGFAAFPQLRVRLQDRLAAGDDDPLPHAAQIARLAQREVEAGRTVGPDEAIPVYLRDDVARPPSRN